MPLLMLLVEVAMRSGLSRFGTAVSYFDGLASDGVDVSFRCFLCSFFDFFP